jgi:hypothetical protein
VAKWSAWVKAYMAEHPGLWETPPKGIRAMARAMSRAETGSAGMCQIACVNEMHFLINQSPQRPSVRLACQRNEPVRGGSSPLGPEEVGATGQ